MGPLGETVLNQGICNEVYIFVVQEKGYEGKNERKT